MGEVLERRGIGNDPAREGSYSLPLHRRSRKFRESGRALFLQMPFENVKTVDISELEKIGVA